MAERTETAARNPEGIGAPVRRREDPRFLTGRGRFVGNLNFPGVVAVLTGRDMAADGVGPMRCLWPIRSRDGTPMAEPSRFPLARDVVHHVGEPVAIVLAETRAAADAAEHVQVEYAPRCRTGRPSVPRTTAAISQKCWRAS